MDSLTGALVAAGVAWASIVAAALVRLPGDVIARLRVAGAASLAGIGLAVLGVPIPGWIPLALLVGGAAAAFALRKPGRPKAADAAADAATVEAVP